MGFEYKIQFANPEWYAGNRERLAGQLRMLPRLKDEMPGLEFRLKDDDADNLWSYDLRVFLGAENVDIEVSSTTKTFTDDLRSLLQWIRNETPAELVDDDGVRLDL